MIAVIYLFYNVFNCSIVVFMYKEIVISFSDIFISENEYSDILWKGQ